MYFMETNFEGLRWIELAENRV